MGKRYKPGITEKRLNNRRFRKTEEAILRVFFEGDIFIGIKDMARKAGVARSTFYHHHRTVREIVPDYKRYIMRKYSVLIRRQLRQKKVSVRKIYGETLFFLIHNRRELEVLIKVGEISILREMVAQNKPKLIDYMRLSRNKDRIFRVYTSEIVEILCEWGEKGFCEDGIKIVLSDVMFLTDTAKVRLSGLT